MKFDKRKVPIFLFPLQKQISKHVVTNKDTDIIALQMLMCFQKDLEMKTSAEPIFIEFGQKLTLQ